MQKVERNLSVANEGEVMMRIVRADGTEKNYGRVGYSHPNPWIELMGRLEIKIRRAYLDRRERCSQSYFSRFLP